MRGTGTWGVVGVLGAAWLWVIGCPTPEPVDDDDDDSADDDDTSGDDDTGDDDDTGVWVSISGGTFQMGSTEGSSDEEPVHPVTVPSFQMWRTEVTVAQYGQCVDAGACDEPYEGSEPYENWGVAGREDHPVNNVDWDQAVAFCDWAGGRLPSESEWEYAARSGGQDITYPWGNEEATCDYAVMYDEATEEIGCGEGHTWAVCGIPAGNTDQGLCDMSGNVWEWVQDWYHGDYTGAPDDGSAWEDPSGSARVIRGGGFHAYAYALRAAARYGNHPGVDHDNLGFRCARSN